MSRREGYARAEKAEVMPDAPSRSYRRNAMRKIGSMAAGLAAVTLLAVTSVTPAFAQAGAEHKTTYLTFSKAVQGPGMTLPAGTDQFRIANPASQTMWQGFNASGTHLFASFFYLPTRGRTISEVNKGDGNP